MSASVGDRLELADRLAELRARPRIRRSLSRAAVPWCRRDSRRGRCAPSPSPCVKMRRRRRRRRRARLVGTRTLSNTSSPSGDGAQAHLLELAARGETGRAALDEEAGDAAVVALAASVTAKTITTSASGPLEMKVLVPLIRNPSPSARRACAARTRRSPSPARSSRARRSACRRTSPGR